ncbi:nectin cell adhesion molecule 1b isoform X1 [Pristis pectinata]|uniref:nectin cell adhesion molecule 1b isoform X1 n=1 Tax=Pristis pectinata TaxID=685728 RepID=UPI00223D444B|nr:nectin cell adhesion molecule 1b isoform X1 [Pristis pectinata]
MDSGLCPRSTARLLLLVAVLPVFQAQTVTVDDSLSGFIGTSVVLRCTFVNNDPKIKITQVTWQKATNGSKQNIAIFHPSMGVSVLPPYQDRVSFKKPSLNDATIELSRLELMDEGVYICEFATFPTGNRESQVNLTVFARPVIDAELTPHTIIARADHPRKIVVATCTCANGKPPGVITWETKVNGETIVKESRNQNGTITVTSQYLLVPSREAHRQPLTCVVNYQMDRTTKVLMLNVQYEPEVTVEGFDGNWYLNRENVRLTCKADGNPPATKYNWKMLNGSLPVNVEPQNTTLLFKGTVTYELAGTYVCEATNAIGTRSGLVEVNITDKPLPQGAPGSVIGILGGIIAAVIIISAIVTIFFIYRRQQKNRADTDNDLIDLPPSHKPPPPEKKTEMKSPLTADDIQVVHVDSTKEEEDVQKMPLQTKYYDMAAPESSPYSEKSYNGNRYEELSDEDEYVSSQHDYHDDYLEQLHPIYNKLSYRPPDRSHHPDAAHRYPQPGSRAPYIYPKEQYV